VGFISIHRDIKYFDVKDNMGYEGNNLDGDLLEINGEYKFINIHFIV